MVLFHSSKQDSPLCSLPFDPAPLSSCYAHSAIREYATIYRLPVKPSTALTNYGGFVHHVESGPRAFWGEWQWEATRYPHTQTDVYFKWAQIAHTIASAHIAALIRRASLASASETCGVGSREIWGLHRASRGGGKEGNVGSRDAEGSPC